MSCAESLIFYSFDVPYHFVKDGLFDFVDLLLDILKGIISGRGNWNG